MILFVPAIACARTEEWVDEALLHDGRTVEVQRKVAFHFAGGELSQALTRWPDEYSLKAKHPDTGESIKWSGERHVNPIMLDFVDGIPYLVVMSARVFSNVKLYGCPEIPYVFLRYEKQMSEWIPVPRNLAPKVLRVANLSADYDGAYMRDGKRQSKEFIAGRYKTAKGSDNGSFTADIPENYDTWDYHYKKGYKNHRHENDCRPPLSFPKPVDSINPQSPVPTSQNVALEILETKEYDPEWVIEADANAAISNWSKLTWDEGRANACKAFFRPVDSENPQLNGWQSFIKDTTGQKVTAYSGSRFCDSNVIWVLDYAAERGRVVIIKATFAGDVIYRISFECPATIRYLGHIMFPTFKSENGYLYFEWWNTKQSGRNRHIARAMKVRLREPLAIP